MKKAQMDYTLVALILLAIFLIVGVQAIVSIFNSRLDEDLINKVCWESVLHNSEKRIPGIEAEHVKVKCPTKYVMIKEEYAEQEYEGNPIDINKAYEPVKLPNIVYKDENRKPCKDAEDEEACMFKYINKIIADEIARCWNNFHRGNKRVFSLYKENARQCVVCSVILFDSELIDEYGDEGPIGFMEPDDLNYNLDLYMRNHNNLRYTGEENYYEYTLDLVDKTFTLPYYDYTMNNEYAVIFVAQNEEAIALIKENLWDMLKERYTDFVPDDEAEGNYINTLEFKPNDQVPTWCDTWG